MRRIFRAWLDRETADGADPRSTFAAIEQRVAGRHLAWRWVTVVAVCAALIVAGVVVRDAATEVEVVEMFVGHGDRPESEALQLYLEVRSHRYAWNETIDGVRTWYLGVVGSGDRERGRASAFDVEPQRLLVEARERGVQADSRERLLRGHLEDGEH